MALIRLQTLHETLVVGEVDNGIREREAAERIHFRKKQTEPCHVCDKEGYMIWVESLDRWKDHPFRCVSVSSLTGKE